MHRTGHCFWEKTSNGCNNEDDRFAFNAYDFYAVCQKANDPHAEYKCENEPAKLTAGECKVRDDGGAKINGHKQKESSSGKADNKEEAAIGDYNLDEEEYCAACDKGAVIVCVALDC